jgi:hypothetical protein
VPLRRLRLALWAYENNPPDDVFRRRLIEAYEALRVYGG